MFEGTPWEVGRNARVERPVMPARHDVDAGLLHLLSFGPTDHVTSSLRVGTGGRHRPALDESLRLDVGSMTPFLSDFLPRSEATKQSKLSLRLDGLLRFARNDGTGRANARPMTGSAKPFFFFVAAMDCLVARAARNDGLPAT